MSVPLREHYELLGVSPDASEDEIKKAFRAKIKIYHPDRSPEDAELARKLIEAYRTINNNPAQGEERVASASPSSSSSYQQGRAAGERMFRGIFGKKRFYSEELINRVSEYLNQRASEADRTHEAEKGAQEREYKKPQGPLTKGEALFDRAEDSLRATVAKFNRQKHRAKRHWANDYIGELGQVQILFRDIVRRHPELYVQANRRLQQLRELIQEIRNIARS